MNGCTGATTDPEKVRRWWELWEGCNIGAATGAAAGFFVLDADRRTGGPDSLKKLEAEHGALPTTLCAKTPDGGKHFYFAYPEGQDIRNSSSIIAPGLDIRGNGGYVVAPPSSTPQGSYAWETKAQIAEPPQWLLTLIAEKSKAAPRYKRFSAGEPIPEGQRNNTLTSYGGKLRSTGLERDEIVAALREINQARCTTPLADSEVEKIADSVSRYPAEDTAKLSTNGHSKPSPTDGDVGVTKLLADAILQEDHFAQDAGGKLYRFSGGTYRQYGERYIKRRVKELLEEWGETTKWSSHRASEVVEYIRADALELWEKPPANEVNVLNGLLNVHTRALREHSPAFLSPVQLPVVYDPEAECPAWEQFVRDVFPEDAQQLAWEIPADLMTPERSIQKSIMLLGEGSNGKSTYLAASSAFVGSTNIVGLSLQKIETDRFSAARLVGKLANICPDLPSTHLTETSMFKALTGGDAINAEYKYKDSFEFRPFARLVFSANHVPRSEDASHAFFRRWLVVPFDRTFEESEQVPRDELDAKLQSPKELSGVLNKALDALPHLRHHGFTESQSMRRAWEEFRAMTDPVAVWLDGHTVELAGASTPKGMLHAAYQQYCDRKGRAGLTSKAFSQAIKRVRPGLEEAQITVAGKRVWAWLGIGLKREPPPGGGEDARDARDARDSCNCFLNEASSADRGSAEDDGSSEITTKGNRVHRVHRVQNSGARESKSDPAEDYDALVEERMSGLDTDLEHWSRDPMAHKDTDKDRFYGEGT